MTLVKRTYSLPKEKKKCVKHDKVYGHIWIDGKRKPIYSYQQITRGKDKGKWACTYLKKANCYKTVCLNWKDITFIPIPHERGKKKPKLVKRR